MPIYVNGSKIQLPGFSKVYVGQDLVYSKNDYFWVDSVGDVQITTTQQTKPNIQYSFDGLSWYDVSWVEYPSRGTAVATISADGKVFIKNNNNIFSDSVFRTMIKCTNEFSVGGNILSLYSSKLMPEYGFIALFTNATTLTDASKLVLPNYTTSNCYNIMFLLCSSLMSAPKLPATNMSEMCYHSMFSDCTALQETPYLPATSLANNCYSDMFLNCGANAPKTIKIAYTGNFSSEYFSNWVNNVSATGDFYYNGSDTTRSIHAIPLGWTVHTFTE